MPTYEYECSNCGHAFELFQRISEKPIRKCPACGKSRARRLLGTGAAVIFKGSGFYVNDYGRSSDYREKKKEESAGSKAAEGASKPAEPKPKADNA